MNNEPIILDSQNLGRALNVVGTKVTVLAPGTRTQGHEITLQSGTAGEGPPLHSHAWDESFYVLKGSVEFRYADQARLCAPGDFVHLPAGTVHGFKYGQDGGEMLEIAGPGSQAAPMFTSIDAEISPSQPDLAKAVEIFEQHGVTVAT